MQQLKRRFLRTYAVFIGIWLLFVILISAILIMSYTLSSTTNVAVLQRVVHEVSLSDGGKITPFILIWLGFIFGSLVGVGYLLVTRLNQKIVAPLEDLRYATEQICAGEYDTEIIGAEDKEIDDLCHTLDEMRLRLKSKSDNEAAILADRNLLIANISHDMRTPVTTIKGYLQAIDDGVASTPQQIENCYGHIRAKTDFLEHLAADMTEYSDHEAGRLRYNFEEIELGGFLRDMAEEFADEAQSKGFVFTTALPEEAVVIRGDRYRLQRVMQNLLSNAVKYNKPGGSIEVVMETTGVYVYIRVADSGIGVAGESLKKVFDSFYREDFSRNSVSGHGLGLAIARQIIQAHRGKIWMQSREGSGTEVFLCLPLMEKEGNKK